MGEITIERVYRLTIAAQKAIGFGKLKAAEKDLRKAADFLELLEQQQREKD